MADPHYYCGEDDRDDVRNPPSGIPRRYQDGRPESWPTAQQLQDALRVALERLNQRHDERMAS